MSRTGSLWRLRWQKELRDIGLIGLAVMGQNLALNMNDHGYTVAVFNRTTSKVDEFLADEAEGDEGGGDALRLQRALCEALEESCRGG